MNKSTNSQRVALFLSLLPMLISAPTFAQQKDLLASQDGHAIVQDVIKPGTEIEFDEDQDEVYRAVQNGDIRPFSELYATVEKTCSVVLLKSNSKKTIMRGFTN